MIHTPVVLGFGIFLLSTLELMSKLQLQINDSDDLLVFVDPFGEIIDITYLNGVYKFRSKINNSTKSYKCITNNLICPLTQDIIPLNTNVRELNCNHIFTQNNIDIWLRKNNSCPICRTIVFSKK